MYVALLTFYAAVESEGADLRVVAVRNVPVLVLKKELSYSQAQWRHKKRKNKYTSVWKGCWPQGATGPSPVGQRTTCTAGQRPKRAALGKLVAGEEPAD